MTDRARTPQRALRGAIVGYGFISENGHLPAYQRLGADFEIVAVADTCATRREKARAALPNARIYDGHERLLENERGHIDFVDVTTPPSEHGPVARAALARGLHVLCEKPLATAAADARAMVALARDVGRVLFPCHNYKHAPVIRAVRRVLDSGALGRVHLVTLQTFRTTHAKGVEDWRRDWRRERRFSGGGIAMDHGSHTFYLAFDWFGAYPTAITAKMATSDGYDTEDNFFCAMTFPGGLATAHLSWTAGVRKVMYTIHGERGAVRVEDDDVEVVTLALDGTTPSNSPATPRHGGGENGANGAAMPIRGNGVLWERRKQQIESGWMDPSHVGWFQSLFGQFASAVHAGNFANHETEASLRCVELITNAYASALDGSRERALPGGR
jgi:predicted dehydrogenase